MGKWIMKITSDKIPNECCVYWTGSNHRHADTAFQSSMKEKLKNYKQGKYKTIKPYFRWAEDTQVVAKHLERTDLVGDALEIYCANLTTRLNNELRLNNC
jgi:hypothetical protein